MPDPRSGVRSLADDLRARTDDDLAALLIARPDLARPAASDLTALAARSTTRSSTARAIDGLDLTTLQVLEAAAVVADGIDATTLDELLPGTPPATIATALDRLRTAALLWGTPGALRVSRGVAEVLGPHIAGLGPTGAELGLALQPPAALRAAITGLPDGARAVLTQLAWGPPMAHEPEQGTRAVEAVDALVDAGLAGRRDDQVVVPREVALVVREGRLHREASPAAPPLEGAVRGVSVLDRVGGGSASEVLALVDDALSAWSTDPPRQLRGGGLSVRDLATTARALDLDPPRAAFVLELALSAGLLADDQGEDPSWAPTAAYDAWLDLPGGRRWALLASTWWSTTRDPTRIGQRRPDGKVVNALGQDVHAPPVRALRRAVLTTLAEAEPGLAPTAASLTARLRWRRPRRVPSDLAPRVAAILDEASRLGLVALGALTTGGRALVAGDTEALAASMETHLPSPVDHVLLQADLTAVAPGPLSAGLAHFLRQVADLESRGGASVHRFSAASIRRCLDAGWTVEEILRGLRDASHTPVPQPLDYLIRDTARQHGQVRVVEARTVLRVEDPAALEALLAERALSALQLRRLAPTIAVSGLAPDVVLEFVQDSGIGAVRENATGAITIAPRPAHRAPVPRVPPSVVRAFTAEDAEAGVAALRAADEQASGTALPPGTTGRGGLAGTTALGKSADRGGAPAIPAGDPATSLALLREASADRRPVWVGYADAVGAVRRFLFRPEDIDNGRVHGVADGVRRTLSIHRITGVAPD